MKKNLIGTIILSIICTTALSNVCLVSVANAAEINPVTIQQNKEIEEKSKKDAKELIDNWSKIKVVPAKQQQQIKQQKIQALKAIGINEPNLVTASANSIYGNYLGSTGDLLITPNSIGGSLTGHAGIIDLQWRYTIESMPNDGVQRRVNDWKTRYSKVIAAEVNNASPDNYLDADDYAANHIGFGYNMNFLNKYETDKFYCSQLVWRAWYNQGFDLDKDGGGAVLPTDLISNKINIIYKSY